MKGFLIPVLATLLALPAAAQVFTVRPEGVDAKYLQFTPTNVQLSTLPLTNRDRQEILRYMQAEQGFAMRPLPVATLKLRANGKLKPSGSDYVELVRKNGIAAEPGKRVVVTDVKVEKNSIVLDFNGGPEHKHKWLRHISIGTDPYYTTPIVADDPNKPTGTRIELEFEHGVPDLTGEQVEALVKPIVDFSVKTPLQAYTDTLPPFLKKAVLAHRVLVGMSRRMVLSTLGEPRTKMRDMEDGKPVEIWIYGEPPDPIQFVRMDGDRVVRLEIAPVGKPMEVHAKNEMGDYWATQPAPNTRIIKLGDQSPTDAANQSVRASAPTLRNHGETLPGDKDSNTPQMKPVEFPKDMGGGAKPASAPQGDAKQQSSGQPSLSEPASGGQQPTLKQPAPSSQPSQTGADGSAPQQ